MNALPEYIWPDPNMPGCYVDAWNGAYDDLAIALRDSAAGVGRPWILAAGEGLITEDEMNRREGVVGYTCLYCGTPLRQATVAEDGVGAPGGWYVPDDGDVFLDSTNDPYATCPGSESGANKGDPHLAVSPVYEREGDE